MNRHEPVRNVMTRDIFTVEVSAPLSQARRLMAAGRFHHLPVCHEHRLVGMISMSDLAPLTLEKWVPDASTVDAWLDQTSSIPEVMSYEPVVVHPHDTVLHAAGLLAEGQFHCLPVTDDENIVVGMLTTTDILRWLSQAT